MASHPVTPQSKQNGSDLHDPFTDEKPEDRFSPDEFGEETASEVHRADEKAPREETPSLFYAYARRTEYPEQGTRHGPQFFSFVGDDFPKKPSTSPKFEHLKTKWFYSQFGDASLTGGRMQEIIPLQDWDGRIIRGGRGGGGEGGGNGAARKAEHKHDVKGKGKAIANDWDDMDNGNDNNDDNGEGEADDSTQRRRNGATTHFDFSGLASSLQSAASIAEMTNAQVSQLTESQFRDQEAIQQSEERLQRMEALVEENAAQLQALGKSHVRAQQQNRELAEQNARILRELKRQRMQTQSLMDTLAAAAAAAAAAATAAEGEGGAVRGSGRTREKEQGEIEGLHVVVHPPPRKINRLMVGYAYQVGEGDGGGGGGDAAGKKTPAAAKRPPAPALERKTTSTTLSGGKSVSGK